MEKKSRRIQFRRQLDSPWSWVVCFSSFTVQFLILGTHNSFGSFFVALLDKFQRSEAETAWIGSLAIGITYMAGPISTSLCYRWGCRVVMCLGSAIFLASMLITSFAPQLSVMYLTYGVLFGFGASCCYFSSFYVLIIYFNKYLALANGIAAAGVGAGTMAISLMIDKLIASYGLRIAFQGMAGLSVLLFLAGLTFIPMDSKEEEKLCEKVSLVKKREENKTLGRLVSSFRKVLKPNPVWRNKAFAAWTIAAGMVFFANYIPYVYLIRFGESIGVPSSQGALLVGYLALAQTFGKILFGKLADFQRLSRQTLTQIGLLVMAVATCLCPLARSHLALLMYSLVSGTCDGCFCVMVGLLTHEIVGREMMAKAVGTMYGVVSIPMTIGPPLAGLLYDNTGSYDLVFFVSSGFVFVGACVIFLIPILLPSTDHESQKVKTADMDVIPETMVDLDDSLFESPKHKVTSRISLPSFGNDFELERNRLLLDGENTNSRPNSFILFSIIPEGSFRDLSIANERYSKSREASFTSLARLSEIRVDSRVDSCDKLETVKEIETSGTCDITDELDSKDLASSSTDLEEKPLSEYSWKRSEGDLSWKTHCSEADTEDSGFLEETSSCQNKDKTQLSGIKEDEINCVEDIKQETDSKGSGYGKEEYVRPLKEGPFNIYPESKKSILFGACVEDQSVSSLIKAAADVNAISHQRVSFAPRASQDIYSELFEEILEEVNDYVNNFPENPEKSWPKVSMTDLKACERETMV